MGAASQTWISKSYKFCLFLPEALEVLKGPCEERRLQPVTGMKTSASSHLAGEDMVVEVVGDLPPSVPLPSSSPAER